MILKNFDICLCSFSESFFENVAIYQNHFSIHVGKMVIAIRYSHMNISFELKDPIQITYVYKLV